MKKGLSLLMVLSLFGFSLAQDQLVIGAALALTGDFATGDVPVLDGVNYIVDKINKEGGVMGQPIKLIVKDMQSDPAVDKLPKNFWMKVCLPLLGRRLLEYRLV
jgi:branched-chain amino acid transport system substrate-binding protein